MPVLSSRLDPQSQEFRDTVSYHRELVAELNIRPLRTYGLTEQGVPELAIQAAQASSTRANPIDLTVEELAEVIVAAL